MLLSNLLSHLGPLDGIIILSMSWFKLLISHDCLPEMYLGLLVKGFVYWYFVKEAFSEPFLVEYFFRVLLCYFLCFIGACWGCGWYISTRSSSACWLCISWVSDLFKYIDIVRTINIWWTVYAYVCSEQCISDQWTIFNLWINNV